MLIANKLTKRYKNQNNDAVKDFTFTFEDKGLYFIVGKSGSGKSTLIKMLGGMDNDYSGCIKYNNIDLKTLNFDKLSEYRCDYIGFSFQDSFINNNETVYEDFLNSISLLDYSLKEKKHLIVEALTKVGLIEKIEELGKNLSGGERKRISLAKAIIKKPDIIFIDEPTGSLDNQTSSMIIKLIEELSKNSLVIVITHDNSLIENHNYLKLENGMLVESKFNKSISKVDIKENSDIKRRNLKKKRKCGLVSLFHLLKSSIKSTFKMVFFSIASINISLTILSFILILTNGVSLGLKESFNDQLDTSFISMQANNIEINKGEDFIELDGFDNIVSEIKEDILQPYVYYDSNINKMFPNSEFYVKNKSKIFKLNNLTIRNFADFSSFYEIDKATLFPKSELHNLSFNEICLMIDSNDLSNFYTLFDVSNLDELSQYLINNKVYLSMNIKNKFTGFEYSFYSPRIRYLCIGKSYGIVHSDDFYNEKLFEDKNVLNLDSTFNKEDLNENPNLLLKHYCIKVEERKAIDLYQKFERNELLNRYQLTINNFNIDNKVFLFDIGTKLLKTFNYDVIDDIKNTSSSDYFNLSNNIYSYLNSDLSAGFNKPFFVSDSKSSLNEIIDNNNITNYDFYDLKNIDLQVSDNVIKGSKTKNKENTLVFENINSLSESEKYNLMSNEILISSSMFEKLFKKEYDNKKYRLECLFLCKSEYIDRLKYYRNSFNDFNLEIVGVVENEKNVIYQSDLFCSAIGFLYGGATSEDLLTTNVVYKFNDKDKIIPSLTKLRNEYDEYIFDIPMIKMKEEVDNTINEITLFLSIFSFICILISFVLLFLSFYLILDLEKSKIKELSIIGFRRKDIFKYYNMYIFVVCFISYVLSIFTTTFANSIVIKQVKDLFGITVPYVYITYLLMMGVILLLYVSTLFLLKIKLKGTKISQLINE